MNQTELDAIIRKHAAWFRGETDGVRANLRGADLLGANLRGANLSGADLRDANLLGANLSGADLRGADLRDANLLGANLSGADLRGANLRGANLRGAVLPTGETWEAYLAETAPALLKAGGHPVSAKAWQCHTWENCPMAEAFDVHSVNDAPTLYRPRIVQFIQFFDAGLIHAL